MLHPWIRHKQQAGILQVSSSSASTLAGRILCTSALLFSFSVSSSAEDDKLQLQKLQLGIAIKEKHVQLQKKHRRQMLDQLQNQDNIIVQTDHQLRYTRTNLSKLNQEIASLTLSINKLEKKQKQQKFILSEQLDAAYRQGPYSDLKLIFSSKESQRSERMLTYFGYLNDARHKSIEDLKKTRTDLSAKKKILVDKQVQQKLLLSRQQIQHQKLKNVQQARKEILTILECSLTKDQAQLFKLRQNESRLRDKIEKAEYKFKSRAARETREAEKILQRQAQAKKKGTNYKPTNNERSLMFRNGGLGTPSGQANWPVRGRIEHHFGEQSQGELHWKGLVIDAPEGTKVKAIADGRVLIADWLQGYGLVIVVEHGKGDMSLYGYNQTALVKVGTQVTAGQPIALVGTNGRLGLPSLYFEIRRQGQAVNPLPWLGR